MAKGTKILLIILIVVATLLAGSTGFFYAKSSSLQKKLDDSQKTADTTTAKVSDVAESTTADATATLPSTTDTTTPVAASSADSRPSSPSDTVVVAAGETLFQIGQKIGVSYTAIAEANGVDADKLKVGQILIIPKNNQIGYTVNKEKARTLQKDVDGGKYAFRLTSLDTAKADTPPLYGLLSTDSYVQGKIDASAGSATVSVVKNDKTYLITLIQPVTKGDEGIWAIESIKPQIK